MAVRQPKTRTARTPPRVHPTQAQTNTAAEIRRAARHAEQVRRDAEDCAKVASLPVQHAHAAGIAVGDASHGVGVEATPTAPTPSANSRRTRPGCASWSPGCSAAP